MYTFVILVIIVLVILIVWWALQRNAQQYKPDFPIHTDEEAEHSASRAAEIHLEEPVVAAAMQAAPPPDRSGVQMAPQFDRAGVQEAPQAVEAEAPAAMEFEMRAAGAPITLESETAASIEVEAPAVMDNLTILEGIGPKVNELLHAAGIHTFAQLAATDAARVREILAASGLQFLDPTTWGEQARMAAEGRMDDLRAFTESLRGGRRVK